MLFNVQQKEELYSYFAPKGGDGEVLPSPKDSRDKSIFVLKDNTNRLIYYLFEGNWILIGVTSTSTPTTMTINGKSVLGVVSTVAANGSNKIFPKPTGGVMGTYKTYVGNSRQMPGTDYSEDNFNVYLAIAPQPGDIVWFDYEK